jgi:hypothetical protein
MAASPKQAHEEFSVTGGLQFRSNALLTAAKYLVHVLNQEIFASCQVFPHQMLRQIRITILERADNRAVAL